MSLAFIGVLVLVGRPLDVGLSTLGSALTMRERAFIAWMAPRGIVAAATSSTFALGLTQARVGGGAQNLIPITFIVIVATALIYGLSGGPVARALGVASTGPGGVLLLGATPVGRAVGRALHDRGLTVLVAFFFIGPVVGIVVVLAVVVIACVLLVRVIKANEM